VGEQGAALAKAGLVPEVRPEQIVKG